jgi:hypothetical protein
MSKRYLQVKTGGYALLSSDFSKMCAEVKPL